MNKHSQLFPPPPHALARDFLSLGEGRRCLLRLRVEENDLQRHCGKRESEGDGEEETGDERQLHEGCHELRVVEPHGGLEHRRQLV